MCIRIISHAPATLSASLFLPFPSLTTITRPHLLEALCGWVKPLELHHRTGGMHWRFDTLQWKGIRRTEGIASELTVAFLGIDSNQLI